MWSDAARAAALEVRRMHSHRSARAKSSHKPSTGDKQKLAADSERRIAKILRSKPTTDKAAFDTLVKKGGKLNSVEIKTLMDNKNDKITMHKDSLARKIAYVRQHNSIAHTVVFDRRGPRPLLYYRKGVGSFRLKSLLKVRNAAHLRELIK